MKLDIGNIVIYTIITAGIMNVLRNYLETALRMPTWDKYLKYAWVAVIPLLAAASTFSLKFITDNFIILLLLFVVYIAYQSKNFRSARLLLIAIVPMLFFGLLGKFCNYLMPDFYTYYKTFFNFIEKFTLFWLIGFGFYSQKQNKLEKIQRQKDEEEKRLLESQKNDLEHLVAARTSELTNQKEELETTLEQLKATQAQLIQSEKLASLGELTAGIAHEIQNPLNFVNNFSELSVELASELKDEMAKPEKDWGLIGELLEDLSQNQDKINHHGKRASSIVKGMLEHSRKSTGVKVPTDINALADEYLRLSYHGLRAKDKDFNAIMETHFETPLSKIEVIPQDIGRVLLNLFNNAFYAGLQKAQLGIKGYEPKVIVTTQQVNNQLVIKVEDNGTGMSESVKSKVFQPFFTTKPTGQGTGLGLSISYDIITKGHGGTLEVETKEGEFTTFIIKLP